VGYNSITMSKKGRWILVVAIIILAGAGAFSFYWLTIRPQNNPTNTTAETSQPNLTAEQCVAELPLDFLVGQLLMIGIYANDMLGQATMFSQKNIGGAILMTAPANPYDGGISQFKTSATSLGVPPLISTDEEGGDVQRFAALGALPAPADVATTLTTKDARQLIAQHGAKLKTVGVDMVLGPLADVAPPASNSVLGNRIFSNNPVLTSYYAMAYVRGWQTANLLPTLKHFPGMGSASTNTDYDMATTPPLSYLENNDFTPYRWLSWTGTAVMVGHQNVPGWFDGPASLSPVVNQYLRDTLGYKNNLIITDALNAPAVTNLVAEPQAIVTAITAGNDMALLVEPSSNLATNESFINEVKTALTEAINSGTLPKQQIETSVFRKLSAQQINPCSLAD
jgi:beta-N-acetylhexosaminidase